MTPKEYAVEQGCKVYNRKGVLVVKYQKKRTKAELEPFTREFVNTAKRIKKAFENDVYVEKIRDDQSRFYYDKKDKRIKKFIMIFERVAK